MKGTCHPSLFILLSALWTLGLAAEDDARSGAGMQGPEAKHLSRVDGEAVEWGVGADRPSLRPAVKRGLHAGWNRFATADKIRFTLRIVELVVENGTLVAGPNPIRVKRGDRVELRLRTNEPAEVHVHGYDIRKSIVPGLAVVTFTAEFMGRFVIESHSHLQQKKGGHSILTYLEVHPG